MKSIKKLVLKAFSKAARPYLKTFGLLQTSKVFNRSALVWVPGNERVVVLAPHMDDEVIGCGGTLARHTKLGAEVTVVFLTDGRLVGRVSGTTEIGALRKEEARAALDSLNVKRIEFLDAHDGSLAASPGLAEKLRKILEECRPDIVYLPFFLEEHPDHRAASDVLAAAVSGTSMNFLCQGYEVWTPLFPNCLVRIDETIEEKRCALSRYQSQLADSDYMHTSLGLNAYRSIAFLDGSCQFAEAFCVLPLREYLEMFKAYKS